MIEILSDYENRLRHICEVLHIGFGLGIELIRQDLTILVELHQELLPDFMDGPVSAFYRTMVHELAALAPDSVIYHNIGNYPLVTLDIRLAEPGQPEYYVSIGPFVTETITQTLIYELLHRHGLSMASSQPLLDFLSAYPILSERTPAVAMLTLALLNSKTDLPAIATRYVTDLQATAQTASPERLELHDSKIHTAYDAERQLRAAITAGNKARAREANQRFIVEDLTYRTPGNPMRTYRNLSYASNTTYRLAAVDGGLDPLTAHQISDGFSTRIENLHNYAEIDSLNRQMIDTYCDAVHEVQTLAYSEPVIRAVLFLKLNFDSPQTLASVAAAIHYSPSYLSHIFKDETGRTIGEYLNDLRVKAAMAILASGQIDIADVALMVGFASYSYFSAQFKKINGLTCRQYVKKLSSRL